jgi:cytochrome c-type biogenesis protein CcmH
VTARAVAALLAAVALLALPAMAPSQERASLPDIEDEVMCPVCGTVLEHAFAPQAERERELIRTLIAQGKTKDEIKDALVAEYGEDVLAVPDDEGFDLAAWVLPIAGFVAAAIAMGLWFRRPRPDGPAPRPLSAEDEEQLRADMARRDDCS